MIKNITALLLSCCIVPAFAQTSPLVQTDTLIVGYDIETALPVSSYSATGVGAAAMSAPSLSTARLRSCWWTASRGNSLT